MAYVSGVGKVSYAVDIAKLKAFDIIENII